MKKTLITSILSCCAVFILLTAFDSGATQQEQVQKINDLLNERLDAFRTAKEQECKDRAMEVAVVRADSMMNASSVKSVVRKKPTYNTKGSTPTVEAPTPPPPPPTTTTTTTPSPPPVAPKDATREEQKAGTATRKKTDAVKKAEQDTRREVQKKSTSTGRRKRSGGN